MSCAPTCAPAPSAPNARLMPTATNSDRLRAASHDAPTANGSSPAGVKTTRRAAPTPAT